MPEENLSTWLSKADVARRLGVSEKTVERLAKRRELHKRKLKIPGRPALPVFNPDDVARLEKQSLQPRPGASGMALAAIRKPDVALAVLLDAIGARKSSTELPSAPNAYLSIRQASLYIGRTQSCIRRAIAEGKLPAVKDRGWRVRKADLDKL